MAMNPDLLRQLLMQRLGGKGGGQGGGLGQGPIPGATPPIAPNPQGPDGNFPTHAMVPPKPGLLQRFQGWVGNNILPANSPDLQGLSSAEQQALRQQAVRQYGMGLMGGAGAHVGLGRNLMQAGLGAQEGLGRTLDRYDRRQMRDYMMRRDERTDAERQAETAYQHGRDLTKDQHQKVEEDIQAKLADSTVRYHDALAKAAGTKNADDANRAALLKAQTDQLKYAQDQVKTILEQAKNEKRPLTQDEIVRINLLHGHAVQNAPFDFGGGGIYGEYVPGQGIVRPGQ